MMGKMAPLIFAAVFLLVCIRTAMRAFAAPWTWNTDQAFFAWLALCLGLVLSVWVTTWLRGGNEAVVVRWKKMLEGPGMSGKRFWRSLLFWIVIAVVLVFIFTATKH